MKDKMEHVDDDGTCRHCGGQVGPDGFSAALGEAEEGELFEGKDTDQHEAGERMRDDAGFADAVRSRRSR